MLRSQPGSSYDNSSWSSNVPVTTRGSLVLKKRIWWLKNWWKVALGIVGGVTVLGLAGFIYFKVRMLKMMLVGGKK